MRTSQALFVFAALFITMCSAAPPNSGASHSSRPRVNCAAFMSALPLPILYLRFSRTAVIFELGYRPACPRAATDSQFVTLSLMVTRSGGAEFQLRSRRFRLAFPRRSA
jgi:hypothetical protein